MPRYCSLGSAGTAFLETGGGTAYAPVAGAPQWPVARQDDSHLEEVNTRAGRVVQWIMQDLFTLPSAVWQTETRLFSSMTGRDKGSKVKERLLCMYLIAL